MHLKSHSRDTQHCHSNKDSPVHLIVMKIFKRTHIGTHSTFWHTHHTDITDRINCCDTETLGNWGPGSHATPWPSTEGGREGDWGKGKGVGNRDREPMQWKLTPKNVSQAFTHYHSSTLTQALCHPFQIWPWNTIGVDSSCHLSLWAYPGNASVWLNYLSCTSCCVSQRSEVITSVPFFFWYLTFILPNTFFLTYDLPAVISAVHEIFSCYL